jgi:hypothetical protein
MSIWDRLMAGIVRLRWLALLLAAGLTGAAALKAKGLRVTSGLSEFLPEDVPEVQTWLDLSRRFDAFNSLLVGLEEPGPAMSVEGLKQVQRVTQALGDLKAEGVLAARSLANIESVSVGADGTINTELLLATVPADKAGLDDLGRRIRADPNVVGSFVSPDLRGFAVLVRADPRKDPTAVANVIRDTVEKERGGLKAFYFGAPFFTAAINRAIQSHLTAIAAVFSLLFLGVALAGIRRAGAIVLVLLCAGTAIVWWLGLLKLQGRDLSPSTANVAIGVGAVALAAFGRGVGMRLLRPGSGLSAFPGSAATTVAATGLAALAMSRLTFHYVASFGAFLAPGMLAVFAVGVLVCAPASSFLSIASSAPSESRRAISPSIGAVLALVIIALGASRAIKAPFLVTPQTMFSPHDEVGETLGFFDRHFGGTDFIQIGFRGDLRDPAVAAHLLRLTDFLEGSGVLPDVRSVAQVLGFLSHNFGGDYGIPHSRESLANIWFFLEGNADVRNLVTDKRGEASVMVRIPAHPAAGMAPLVAAIDSAVYLSASFGPYATHERILALARHYAVTLDPKVVDAVVSASSHDATEADLAAADAVATGRLHTWLGSDDSPYKPTDDEWTALSAALAGSSTGVRERLIGATASMDGLKTRGITAEFIDAVVTRQKDLRQSARAQLLAQSLWAGKGDVPEGFRMRVQGAIADALDPPPTGGDVAITLSGLPVLAGLIASDLRAGLVTAAEWLLVIGAVALIVLSLKPVPAARRAIEAAAAMALTVIVCRSAGVDIDSGSATLYLVPAAACLVASSAGEWAARWGAVFLVALAAGGLALLVPGVLPVTRVGSVMAIGLGTAGFVSYVSAYFRPREATAH